MDNLIIIYQLKTIKIFCCGIYDTANFQRVARLLERAGLIESAENTYLAAEGSPDNNEMIEHQSHSITYRIAVGPGVLEDLEMAFLLMREAQHPCSCGMLVEISGHIYLYKSLTNIYMK